MIDIPLAPFRRDFDDARDPLTARNRLGAAGLESPAFTGSPTTTTPGASSDDTSIPTTEWVNDTIATSIAAASAAAKDAFVADKNGSNQAAVTSNVFTKITFGTARLNVDGNYDAGTSRWTPAAGNVVLLAQVYCVSGLNATTVSMQTAIYKNGTILRAGITQVTGTFGGCSVAVVDAANGTDYYEVWILVQGAGVPSGTVSWTYFQGHAI